MAELDTGGFTRIEKAPASSDTADGWTRLKKVAAKAEQPKTEAPKGEEPGESDIWSGLASVAKAGLRGAAQGIAETGIGTAQLISHAIPGSLGDKARANVEAQLKSSQADYAGSPARLAHPNIAEAGRIGGDIAATAPLGMVAAPARAGMLARAGLGAATGAAGGATQPVTAGNFAAEKAMQTGIGAGLGGGVGGAGAMIGPRIAPAFQAIAQKFPNFVRMATGAEGRDLNAFNRSTANQVLQPLVELGEAKPIAPTMKAGHKLVNQVTDAYSDAYNKVLPKLTFRSTDPDPYTGKTFLDGLSEVGKRVPKAHVDDFNALVKGEITEKLDAAGNMPGKAFKDAESFIGQEAKAYAIGNANPDQLKYSRALRSLQAEMRQSLASSNPEQAPFLQKINEGWGMLVKMEDAAGRHIDRDGVFTPNDLLYSVRQAIGRRRFGRGDDDLLTFGEAGNDLLAGRPVNIAKHAAALMGATAGGAAGHALGPVGAGVGAYAGHQAGQAMGESLGGAISRARATPEARAFGRGISELAPVAGRVGAAEGDAYVSGVGP